MGPREVAADNRRAYVAGGLGWAAIQRPISTPGRFRPIEAKRALRGNLNNRKSYVSSGAWASAPISGIRLDVTDGMTPSLKGCHRIAREHRLQRTQENGSLLGARLRQIRCRQEARHKGAEGHQSVHEGANNIALRAADAGSGAAQPRHRPRFLVIRISVSNTQCRNRIRTTGEPGLTIPQTRFRSGKWMAPSLPPPPSGGGGGGG